MSIVSQTFGVAGQVGVTPRRVQLTVTDSLSVLMTPGYLTQSNLSPNAAYPTDIFDIVYGYNTSTGVGTYIQMLPLILAGGVISLYQAPSVLNKNITLLQSDVQAAYATPVLLLDAPAAGYGNTIIAGSVTTVVGTAFANGGVGVIQYSSTPHGAGGFAMNGTFPAAEITAATSQYYIGLPFTQGGTVATSAIAGLGVYFSNQTSAFTGGANSKVIISLQYAIVPMA